MKTPPEQTPETPAEPSDAESVSTVMPVVIGDYWKYTQHLSAEEHGAFFLLMMQCWLHDEIKSDKKTLKNITKLSLNKLQNVLPFFIEKNGMLHNKTINELKAEAIENRRKKKNQTTAATAARAAKKAAELAAADNVTNNVTSHPASASPSPSAGIGENNHPSNPNIQKSDLSKKGDSILKNSFFDILIFLSDKDLQRAKAASGPERDFYNLVRVYNRWISDDRSRLPAKPAPAFIKWLASYTKDMD